MLGKATPPDWEKEFDEKFLNYTLSDPTAFFNGRETTQELRGDTKHLIQSRQEVKDFIRQTLASQLSVIEGIIEGMKKDDLAAWADIPFGAYEAQQIYNSALSTLLDKLKKK